MATTFQKRQKEMKRMEKRKMKEEKRAQRKLEKTALKESGQTDAETVTPPEQDAPSDNPAQPHKDNSL